MSTERLTVSTPTASGPPRRPPPVPPAVERIAAGRPVRTVWANEVGGLTLEVGAGAGRCFVKWAPTGSGIDLTGEVQRARWAGAFAAVPRVLDEGADETGAWFVSAALPGQSAVSERWTAEPDRAVEAIGRGLRTLHDTLPVPACPFSWSAEERLATVRSRAAAGMLGPRDGGPEHQDLTVSEALAILEDVPPLDRLVVCHGDACSPNTLIDERGLPSGHVDLGSLGVADRWADLAIATWSTQWNYGRGWETRLLEAYGVEPDPHRTAYYRLLWDLCP